MSHFVPELFLDPKIHLTFTSVVTHAHPIKKVITRLETLTRMTCLLGVLMDFCPYVTFSNRTSMTELRK